MIRYEQSLQLRRLVVRKGAGSLYDEEFHPGVNIIRGENSSGKSTIADLIFFALGGEVSKWSREAMAAESVHAEVLLSGRIFTLTREIGVSGKAPISLFEGDFQQAMADRGQWMRYPSARSSETESFSQVIFRLLKLPPQKTDAQQNITMHQVLRLLYCDQMTPVEQIFRQERSYDARDIRIAVGELLLGSDDLVLHDLRMNLRDTDKKYSEVSGELSSIFKLLGRTEDSDIADLNFEAESRRLQEERAGILAAVEVLSSQRDLVSRQEAGAKGEEVAKRLLEVNSALVAERQDVDRLAIEIDDSRRFIRALEERISAIDASSSMAAFLGGVPFTFCPACLSPILGKHDGDACRLCKEPLSTEGPHGAYLKMREELEFQRRESVKLLEVRAKLASELQLSLAGLSMEQKQLIASLNEFTNRVDPVDAEIANQLKRVGYIDRSIEDLSRKAELAALVKEKMAERARLSEILDETRLRVERLEEAQRKRREFLASRINGLIVHALHSDLQMEETFIEAETVQVDFGQNHMAVNGRVRFSASSSTYLKNSVLFSLFELSLQEPEVRWPRFILLDNIEDKGMQPKRSANFQEYIVERSGKYEIEHQVILTTSMISPLLEDSDLCVGPHYNEKRKTLEFAGKR